MANSASTSSSAKAGSVPSTVATTRPDGPIAIKCLKLPAALGTTLVDSFVQRFRDESRILYRLSQGNLHIVRSIAAGTTQAPATGALVPYMVLEWLEGRSVQSDFTVRRPSARRGARSTRS